MTLDAAFYPHIFQLVLSFAPHDSLLALRRASRAVRAEADKRLFALVKVARRLSKVGHPTKWWVALSLDGRRLPVRQFSYAQLKGGLPSLEQWAAVRVLDTPRCLYAEERYISCHCFRCDNHEVYVRTTALPALTTIRGGVPSGDVDTVVDMLRFPDPKMRYHGRPKLQRKEARHQVLLATYNPEWVAKNDLAYMSDWWSSRQVGHEITIFLPAEREGSPRGRLFDDGDRFLALPMYRAARRTRERFTLVGIEAMPITLLKRYGFSDAELALAHDGTDEEWAAAVRTRILASIREIWGQPAQQNNHDPSRMLYFDRLPVEDYIEILTLAEYRARVGEEEWELHTFGGFDPGEV